MTHPDTIAGFLKADLDIEYSCLHCPSHYIASLRHLAFDRPEVAKMTVDEFLAQAVCDNFFCKRTGARYLRAHRRTVMLYGRYCPPDIDHAAWMAADLEERARLAKWRPRGDDDAISESR